MTTEEYRIGIEEEYFIIDGETKSALRRMPAPFMDQARGALGEAVSGEMLQSQIEMMTRPHVSAADARRQLHGLRRSLGEVAAEFDLAFLAAGTHPTASWQTGKRTPTQRYDGLMHDLQMVGERNMLCGMHVHVELPDADQRIDVMRRIVPYLPIFVALSTSSPFWESKRTGLMGYRLAAYDELPRTGLPELFETAKDYQDYVDALVAARAIRDSSYVWWTIRPSQKHPTLELRAPDSCTRVEDSVAIAALYRALVRHLVRDPKLNAGIDAVDPGQFEAAQSLGMSRAKLMRRVVLPQAFKVALPPYGNNVVMMLKDSSQTAVITVVELSMQSKLIASATFKSATIFTLVALMYLAMSLPMMYCIGKLERRLGRRQ